jgi:heavy metal sensor kinase
MSLPIRARLTAWYIALLAAILVALGAFVAVSLERDLTAAVEHSVLVAAHHIGAGYETEGRKNFRDVAATALEPSAAAELVDPSGHVTVRAGVPLARRPLLGPADRAAILRGSTIRRTLALPPQGEDFRVIGFRVTRRGAAGVLIAAESLDGARSATDRVISLLLIAGPAALLLTAAGGWWLARKALRPVGRMAAHAERIEIDALDERISAGRAGDELDRLATTLNAMLDRLARGVEHRRRLVADASHELRTPLAVMRVEIDVALDDAALDPDAREVLESAREEVDRLRAIVDGLLVLARIDERELELRPERVDLLELGRTVASGVAPLAAERGVRIDVDGVSAPTVGDPERLGRALGNLVDNAVKASPAGAVVTVTAVRGVQEVGVAVDDRGPGIPAHELERIFERFARLDGARRREHGGSGLGLAICREIAAAHGGSVTVTSSPEGSRFLLSLASLSTLPVAQDA